MSKNIMILAGEASGDLQGAHLADMLTRLDPSCHITGIGGPLMKEKGVELIHDSSAWGIIGPWNAFKKIPFLLRLVKEMKKRILEICPELLILIDTPSINMRLARFAKNNGVKTLYFFPPSAWFPNVERARKIAHSVHHIVPVFSYTVKTYKNAGINVEYFGHPLIDMLPVNSKREDILKNLCLDQERIYVGIFPGSREQEITSLMPVLLKSVEILRKERDDIDFLLPVASPSLRPLIMRMLKGYERQLRIIEGHSHEVMRVSHLVIMACGSASLEAAIVETPMIILYKLAWPDWCIAKLFIKVPFISLPNLILQREVVPELLQLNAHPRKIAKLAKDLVDDTPLRHKMLEDFREVRKDLGEEGVIERIGKFVFELCPKPEM